MRQNGLLKTILLVGIGVMALNVANAYHIFVTNNESDKSAWDLTEFTTDQSAVTIPGPGGLPATGAGPFASPNDDDLGVLFLVDHFYSFNDAPTEDCAAVSPHEPAGSEPYDSIFAAMATWNAVSTARVNFQYVCSDDDFNEDSVDGDVDGIDVEILNGMGGFLLNGFNEILLDDDTAGPLFAAVLGAADTTSLLGVGITLDAFGGAYPSSTTVNPITEAVMILNETPESPLYDRQGVVTHELGHTLGLGHTNAVLNARGCCFPGQPDKLNDGTVPASEERIPTMYAFALSAAGFERTLEIDDLGGITLNYPAASAGTSLGAISGTILNHLGEPILGASVIAYDAAGDEIGKFVGGSPELPLNFTGAYRIDFVPPGDYTVILIPMDGSSASAGIDPFTRVDGVFPASAAIFAEAYYDNVATESAATTVTVVAAMETTGIDFVGITTTNSTGTLPGPIPIVGALSSHSGGTCTAVVGSVSLVSGLFNLFCLLLPLAFLHGRRKRR